MLSGKLPFQGSVAELISDQIAKRSPKNVPRKRAFRWLLGAFVALLLASVAMSVWLMQSQQHSNEQIQALQEKFDKLLRGVNSFAEVQNKVRQEQPGQKPDEIEHGPSKNPETIKAFELAAWAAEKRIEYADALKRLREAENLSDRTRDAVEWARVQFAIAYVLYDQGQYSEAERIFREVLKERERVLGPEHPDTLATRNGLENAPLGRLALRRSHRKGKLIPAKGVVFDDMNLLNIRLAFDMDSPQVRTQGGCKSLSSAHRRLTRQE
jgi:tetratricopeptide (TPR) repeat protein